MCIPWTTIRMHLSHVYVYKYLILIFKTTICIFTAPFHFLKYYEKPSATGEQLWSDQARILIMTLRTSSKFDQFRTRKLLKTNSGYSQLLRLPHNCKDCFHLHSLSTVHSYDLYHLHIMSFSSYNRYKLNSHLTCYQWGFTAQSVEHHTGIVEVMVRIPLEP